MLRTFEPALDRRLSRMTLSPSAHDAIAKQRDKLAGAELPADWDAATRREAARAIDESFVSGYRLVMALGAMLAIGSALSAWLLLRTRDSQATAPNE